MNYVTVKGKVITIDFSKFIAGKTVDSKYCKFTLSRRAFYAVNQKIADNLNYAFENCDAIHIAIPYLTLSYEIHKKDDYPDLSDWDSLKEFTNKLFNKHVIEFINNKVETHHVHYSLDDEVKKSTKVNQELQFTDEHVKIILKLAESIRLVIPLFSEYCNEHPEYSINDLIYDFTTIIVEHYKGEVNILNKLQKFIYSRIVSTNYSDSVLWKLLNSHSKDIKNISNEYLKDCIVTILPKVSYEQSFVSFIHVVINNKLNSEFSKNHKFALKPVNLNQTDSEGLTEFDKMDIMQTKINEGKTILNKLTIKKEMANLQVKFGVTIKAKEFNYYLEHVHINHFQTNMLFLFYAKYMGSYNVLYNADRKQYVYLLIIMVKYLTKKGNTILPKYLLAIPDKLNERRVISKSKLFEVIYDSKIFHRLMVDKYHYISQNITDSLVILKMIGNLSISKFIILPEWSNKMKTGEEFEKVELTCKIEQLSKEILDLIENI